MSQKKVITMLLLLFLLGFGLWPRYIIHSQASDMKVVTHRSEMFIFIEQTTYGWSGCIAQRLLLSALGMMQYKIIETDLFAYHVQNGKLDLQILKSVPLGQAFLYQDELYYYGLSSSGNLIMSKWQVNRWNEVDAKATNEISASIKNRSGYGFSKTNSGNWFEMDGYHLLLSAPTNPSERRTKFNLSGRRYDFIIDQCQAGTNRPYSESFNISGFGLHQPAEVLYLWQLSDRNVSRKTYLSFH